MINIPVSIGELVDKITILEIKIECIKDKAKLKNCRYEYELLTRIQRENDFFFPHDQEQLKKVNLHLWNIEDLMRRAEANQTFGENFVKLTRDQYRANDLRAKIKRQINEKAGSEIVEEKDYVAYKE